MKAIDGFFTDLKAKGSQKEYIDKMQSRAELYKLLRYTPGEEWHYPETDEKNKSK